MKEAARLGPVLNILNIDDLGDLGMGRQCIDNVSICQPPGHI